MDQKIKLQMSAVAASYEIRLKWKSREILEKARSRLNC